MRRRIVVAVVVLSMLGFTGVAEASTVHVHCRSSALVNAIVVANATPGTTLSLTPGCVYKLHSAVTAGDGLPQMTSTTTIVGHGATIVRKSATQFRVFDIGLGGNVSIRSLKIKGGYAPDGPVGAAGGGILNSGTLVLRHVTLAHNRAGASTAGLPGGAGGAIFNGFGATLRVIRSRIVGNRAGMGGIGAPPASGGYGGGIFSDGTLEINHTTIAHNDTGSPGAAPALGGLGGGIYLANATSVTISHSLITRNTAVAGGQGGGIYNGGVALVVVPVKTRIARNRPDNCAPAGSVAHCSH